MYDTEYSYNIILAGKRIQQKCITITILCSAGIFSILALILWIAMGVVVSIPPNGSKWSLWWY